MLADARSSAADPLAFYPDVERARAISAGLRDRLASSLSEIADASRGIVPFDEPAVAGVIDTIRNSERVRPAIYAMHYEILLAVAAQNYDEAGALFDELCGAPLPAGPLSWHTLSDRDLGAGNASRYVRWFDVDDEAPLAIASIDSESYARGAALGAAALALFDRAAPAVSGEIRSILTEIVLARNAQGSRLLFQGASSFYLWGTVLINVDEHPTDVDMAAALVHECAHSLLFGMAVDGPLVLNPEEERYRSPLRPDLRPMDGIYHATYVSARMCYAMARLLDAGDLDADAQEKARAMMNADAACFREGLGVVREHGRLTDLGQSLMAAAEESMGATA